MQVEESDQEPEQYRVRDAQCRGPQKSADAGDERCEQVAEKVTTHPREYLVQ